MKKLKLKKKLKSSKFRILIMIIVLISIVTLLVINTIGKKVSDKLIVFAESEVSKITKLIVNKAVTEAIIEQMDVNKLFIVQKNSVGDIQLIDFDPEIVNKILNDISDYIVGYFEELENGDSSILDIKNNLITNTKISSKKKGVILEVPIGIISNNPLISNLGPKIPVRISFDGELESCLKTDVQNYGINNAVITVSVNIEVSEKILMPITTKQITISNDIPVAVKIIKGQIPNYYFNGLNENSNLFTIPFNG